MLRGYWNRGEWILRAEFLVILKLIYHVRGIFIIWDFSQKCPVGSNMLVPDSISISIEIIIEMILVIPHHAVYSRLQREINPLVTEGKLFVIDGGISKAYRKVTGIAGYTLIYNSYGLILAAHEPFESTEAAIEKESDIHSDSIVVKRVVQRKMVGDTDIGRF